MSGERDQVVPKGRTTSFGGFVVIMCFAFSLLVALAATTGSYSPPHPGIRFGRTKQILGMNMRPILRAATFPMLLIYQGCGSCSAVDPLRAAREMGVAEFTWTLDSEGELKHVSSGKRFEGQRLLERLRPEWNPQIYGFDGEGIIRRVQTGSFGDREFKEFIDGWKGLYEARNIKR